MTKRHRRCSRAAVLASRRRWDTRKCAKSDFNQGSQFYVEATVKRRSQQLDDLRDLGAVEELGGVSLRLRAEREGWYCSKFRVSADIWIGIWEQRQ